MPTAATPWDAWSPNSTVGGNRIQTKEEFLAKYANGIDANGNFKGPQFGIRYDLEGQNAGNVYDNEIGGRTIQQWKSNGDEGSSWVDVFMPQKTSVDAGWRPGPDNGGGFFGGLGRAVKGMVNGVASIPPLRMAADALTGGAAEWVFGANAIDNGGNIADVAKSMALSYVGGQLGGMANEAIGGGTLGNMAGGAVKSLTSGGNPLLGALTSGAGSLLDDTSLSADDKKLLNSFAGSALRQVANNSHSVKGGQFISKPHIKDELVSDERAKSSTAALEELLAMLERRAPSGSIAGRMSSMYPTFDGYA
jgi:hypothetical protein